MKLTFVVSFILIFSVNSDFVEDNLDDIMNCLNTDKNSCSSTSLKTPNLECCLVDYYEWEEEEEEEEEKHDQTCSLYFTTYISQSMIADRRRSNIFRILWNIPSIFRC